MKKQITEQQKEELKILHQKVNNLFKVQLVFNTKKSQVRYTQELKLIAIFYLFRNTNNTTSQIALMTGQSESAIIYAVKIVMNKRKIKNEFTKNLNLLLND